MTGYKPGDTVLVDFGYSENTGSKKRPALVVSSEKYHHSRHDIIVMAITSNINRILAGDTKVDNWKPAGLHFPSVVTGVIRTIKVDMIIRKLGTLAKHDLNKVQESLRAAISLE